jgi:chromosome segregation ATPase
MSDLERETGALRERGERDTARIVELLEQAVALREENARLSTAVCFLERCQEQTNTECDRLRAQVAALEQLVEDYRLSAKAQHEQAVEARAHVAALMGVVEAARIEHEGVCPRRPQPEKGFLGACNICARLIALDAGEKP